MSHYKPTTYNFLENSQISLEDKNKIQELSLTKFSANMNQFRKDFRFCDFELRVQSKVFPTHKLVLSAASPYFETMFKDCFIENSNNYIEIKDIDNPDIIEIILEYIYTGSIEVDSHNVQEIVQISSIFQLTDLLIYCEKFLQNNLQTYNCIGLLCFADLYELSVLCFEAKRYIENNFAEIVNEDEFLELPANLFKSFLKSENLSISSEYQVLLGTIQWILHKPQERIQFLNEFIDIIRMPIIPQDKIGALIERYDNSAVTEILSRHLKAEKRIMFHENFDGYDSVRCKPRMASRRLVYIFGGQKPSFDHQFHRESLDRELNTLCTVEKFDFHTGTWTKVTSLTYPRCCHCVVKLDNKIFVIGGICDSLILETVEIYDPSKNEFTMGSRLKSPRSAFGACVHESYIYAFGGLGGGGITVERYNPISNAWEMYDNMPSFRYDMQVIEHDGIIYIIGGSNFHHKVLNSVISYDPKKKTFQELAPLLHARKSFAATVMHNYIYVFGGLGPNKHMLNSVERYNINENRWSYINEMRNPKSNLCAVSINNLVYLYGGDGLGNERFGKIVNVYDPENNEWMTHKPMTQGRKNAAILLV